MAYTINFLSASAFGAPIQITGTGNVGSNAIHTGIAGTTQMDEVFLYANSTGSQFYPLVLQVAGTGAAYDLKMTIAPQDSPQLILPGWPINSSLVIKAYSPSGSGMFLIGGYIQRGP